MGDAERVPLDELADWLEGRLTPDHAARAEKAANEDPAARRAVEWLRGFLDVSRGVPLHAPPPIVRQRLQQAFRQRFGTEVEEAVRELMAELEFDSRRSLATAGMRGGPAEASTLHLAYATEVADVVLDVTRRDPGTVTIDAQVLLAGVADYPVFTARAMSGTTVTGTSEGDALGRFRLAGVPTDVDRLVAENGRVRIVVDLDLGEPW